MEVGKGYDIERPTVTIGPSEGTGATFHTIPKPVPTLQDAIGPFDLLDKSELIDALKTLDVVLTLRGDAREVLLQLIKHGPVYDGDLVSKAGRDQLLRCGVAAKVMVKGQYGYQAATYAGNEMHKIIEALKAHMNFKA